jgi:hypothetical protein
MSETPVSDTLTLYSETLLAKAQELIAKKEFSIAVAVAPMACELSAGRAISRAFTEKGIAGMFYSTRAKSGHRAAH